MGLDIADLLRNSLGNVVVGAGIFAAGIWIGKKQSERFVFKRERRTWLIAFSIGIDSFQEKIDPLGLSWRATESLDWMIHLLVTVSNILPLYTPCKKSW